jgi:hypothetical protein
MKSTIILILLLVTVLALPEAAVAQVKRAETSMQDVKVQAKVGEFYLSVSGIISPLASLSLSSKGNVYKAAIADSRGRFSFSGILVNRGFSSFCIDAIDVSRLGESYTCFTFQPAEADIVMHEIFLPPTLGLNHYEINAGDDVLLSGYGMPGSQVTVSISETNTVTVTADTKGRYEYKLKKVKSGLYQLVAGATFEGKKSLLPSRKILLRALAFSEAAANALHNTINWIAEAAPLLWLLLLILFVPLYIWREKVLTFLHLRKKKLHHGWFVGY